MIFKLFLGDFTAAKLSRQSISLSFKSRNGLVPGFLEDLRAEKLLVCCYSPTSFEQGKLRK
jgi:hypothetical protein